MAHPTPHDCIGVWMKVAKVCGKEQWKTLG